MSVFEQLPLDSKMYEASARTLDELWQDIRSVIGETKRDVYNEGFLSDVRDTGQIIIRWDHEFSLWVANITVRLGY